MLITVVAVFVGLMFFVAYWLPSRISIDTASTSSNATFQISVQSVPTVINGIATVTSIVVGFTAAVVGLVVREILGHGEKEEKLRRYMIGGLLFLFPSILLLDFWAYINLLMGEEWRFVLAITTSLEAFVLALLVLVSIFILVWLVNAEHERREKESKTPKPKDKDSESPSYESAKAKEEPLVEKILELVQWIDEQEKNLFKLYDAFGGMGRTFLMIFAVIFFITEFVNFTISDFATKISIQLTSISILIATIALVLDMGEKRKPEIRFERALNKKSFSDREKALLRALVKIKSKNEEIKLMTIYEMDKEANGDIFTEKKLLESKYHLP
jgi:uncharacterized membrane protein YqjE